MKQTLTLALLMLALYAKGQNRESGSVSQVISLHLQGPSFITRSDLSLEKVQIRSAKTWITQKEIIFGHSGLFSSQPSELKFFSPLKRSSSIVITPITYITVSPE